MDGRNVARHLKELSHTTPIVLLSGTSNVTLSGSGTPTHIDLVIAKPPNTQILLASLQRLVEAPAKPIW